MKATITLDDVNTMAGVAATLRHFALSCDFISARFYDGVLFVHLSEDEMMNMFAETAEWERREDRHFPIRLVVQLDGVAWFSLFTEKGAAQWGCPL